MASHYDAGSTLHGICLAVTGGETSAREFFVLTAVLKLRLASRIGGVKHSTGPSNHRTSLSLVVSHHLSAEVSRRSNAK